MEKKINNYVATLNIEQISQLKQIFIERDWEIVTAPHAHWKAKHININVIAYKSGKLVIQGKGTEDFVLFTLEPDILQEAKLGYNDDERTKKSETDSPFTPHTGIDESGKGDFFGPLVIAAVFVDSTSLSKLEKLGIKDSKLIKNDNKILTMAKSIKSCTSGNFSVVAIGPEAYNRLYMNFKNLNKLLAWGHSRALENILEKDIASPWALSDKFGNEKLIINALFKKGKQIELRQQTKAESDIAVAAASILARAEFVTKIAQLGQKIGITLPKGASKAVIETGNQILAKYDSYKFNEISKTHFKTMQQILG